MTQIETIIAEVERRMYENQQNYSEEGVGAFYEDRQLLSFINSFPAEQLSEELEEAAKEYVKENAIIPENCHDCEVPMYLMESATIFKDGAKWQKQQIINKACKWLNQNVVEYHPRTGKLRPIVNINAFREAMENEQ